MGEFDVDVPPIPGKEGTYDYFKGNIIYIPKGKKAENGTIVAPYVPRKKGPEERQKDYEEKVTADVNQVIAEIEESKNHVDAKARKHAIDKYL